MTSSRDPDREALRAEFVQARSEFARVTAEALSSEEVTNWVRGLSQRVRERRMQEDLRDVRAALDSLERTGNSGTERAERLIEREASLSRDLERVRVPSEGTPSDGAVAPVEGIAMPDQATVRHWIEREMSEETDLLADTLSDRELARRTRRLHRLATLARFARRVPTQQSDPQPIPNVQNSPAGGGVVPASGIAPAAGRDQDGESSELGQPTTAPPELPEPTPQKGTARPSDSLGNDSKINAENRSSDSRSPNP